AADTLAARLAALQRNGHRDLALPESHDLAVVGTAVGDAIYSPDALAYAEGLATLRRAGLLPQRGDDDKAAITWEIEPRWGGFAQRLHRAIGNCCHIVIGRPARIAHAALALVLAEPRASFAFHRRRAPLPLPSRV